MSEINIRRAVIGDYKGVSALMDELHRLHVEARPDVYRELQPRMSHKEYEQLLETDHRHLYVAELLEQGEIVGYASAQLNVIQNVTLLTIEGCYTSMKSSLAANIVDMGQVNC